ncbi:MAG: hypothetical protein J7521_01265 [Caulobacter sp.]|nr:hypothetical protein [Caulobacter sp.]
MKTSMLKTALAVLMAGTAVSSAAMAAEKPVVIALEPYLGVVWSFQAQLKGRPETYLLDTAGGLTVIQPQTAAEAGCEPWGQVTGFRMRGDRVDVARCDDLTFTASGATLKTPTAGVWDMSKILPKDAPPLAGSIALDSFAGKVVTLDLSRKQLVIETADSLKARIAVAKEVEMRVSREATGVALTPFVAVKTPKGKLWMELDSGSAGAVMVGSHTAEVLGLKADAKGAQPLKAELAGGVPLETDKAGVLPLIMDGNIGAPILAQWVVTLDLARNRAWIAPAK